MPVASENGEPMSLERSVRLLAGSMVLVGVLLAVLVSPWWLLLTAFVGINLFQSSLTGFCPAENVLCRVGVEADRRPSAPASSGR
jgi:hypothetical protein